MRLSKIETGDNEKHCQEEEKEKDKKNWMM